MARVKNPKTLTGYFNIDRRTLNRLGVLDPTLAVDTRLFIDPLLFQYSRHSEISKNAIKQYRDHFETVIKFLAATRKLEDVAWRTARRLLEFHEIRGTWYRDGTDVNTRLPWLATYMGHVGIVSTHVYLQATAELLQEVGTRFRSHYLQQVQTQGERS